MVIWPEFHMRQFRDDNHREDAPFFTNIDLLDKMTSLTQWSSEKNIFGEKSRRVKILLVHIGDNGDLAAVLLF